MHVHRILAHLYLAPTKVLHRPRSVHPSVARERCGNTCLFRGSTVLSGLSDRHWFWSGDSNVDDIAMLHASDGLRHAAVQFTGRCDMPRMLDRFPAAWRSQRCVEDSTEAALPLHDQLRVHSDIRTAPYLKLSYCTTIASSCRTFPRSLGSPYKPAHSKYGVIARVPRALGNTRSVLGRFARLVRAHVRCNAEAPQHANT